LQIAAKEFARAHVHQDAGDLVFTAEALLLESEDSPRRVMAAGLMWIGGNVYRPRFERMMNVVAQVRNGETVTLGGCLFTPMPGGGLRMTREAAATSSISHSTQQCEANGVIWDRRWFVEGPLAPGLVFCTLGDGLRDCPDWRAVDIPRASLMASPSVWSGDRLIAAPVAGFCNGWTAQIVADLHEHAFAH
jgi:tRNA(Ile)-lysidine synthase